MAVNKSAHCVFQVDFLPRECEVFFSFKCPTLTSTQQPGQSKRAITALNVILSHTANGELKNLQRDSLDPSFKQSTLPHSLGLGCDHVLVSQLLHPGVIRPGGSHGDMFPRALHFFIAGQDLYVSRTKNSQTIPAPHLQHSLQEL